MKLNEIVKKEGPSKAGFIPYIWEANGPVFMFMKSSDPQYGGDRPMIAKGHVDKGESILQAAIREAEEELGLKSNNLKKETILKVWTGKLAGLTANYTMVVYAAEVEDKYNFAKPHFETESVHWMTLEQFKTQGRTNQVNIVEQAYSLLVAKNKLK